MTTSGRGERRGEVVPLRILIVEDTPHDAELVVLHLRREGFEPDWVRVDTEADYLAALDPAFDVILSDFNLPAFGPIRALELLHERGLDIPLIVVSGSIGEDVAVTLLRQGAADYLLKDRLTRLGQAIQRVIGERLVQREKRHTEEQFRQTVERTDFALRSAGVGTWEADLSRGTVAWSPTLEAMHGLPGGSFGASLDAFLDVVAQEDRQQVRDAIMGGVTDQSEWSLLYRVRWPDSKVHWVQTIGRTMFDAAGGPVRTAGIAFDVTERRTLEEQYRQSQKMEAIGQLAGGVAHDFNNLLTSILGYTDLLIEQLPEAGEHQSHLAEVRRAAESAAGLTRQLLAFGRRQIVEPRVLDLRDVVNGLLPMLRRTIGEQVKIDVDMERAGGHIKADPVQMEQVILNLAINARDAMPRGGTLRIDLSNIELDEHYVRQHADTTKGPHMMLAVSDTGTGMSAETQARVFEPFFTTKAKGRGTGLGLSTVLGIVQQSGGTVWLYSEVGRGSTFKVLLPRVDEPLERVPSERIDPERLVCSETILIVEDEKGVRALVRRILEGYGYRILSAATPQQALDLIAETTEPIHLLISDIVLPDMPGPELAARIVVIRPDIKVLYSSGYTDGDIVQRGILAEGVPFLQKPYLPAILGRKVRELLDSPTR